MKELHWQYNNNAISIVPETLLDWIFDPGSFVQRLKHHGISSPQIDVLYQGWQLPTSDERRILGINARIYTLIREVLIKSEEGAWMFARTVFPHKTLTGKERCLAWLKNRSLGSVLFKNPDLLRSDFEVACITQKDDWYEKVVTQVAIPQVNLWARRSTFSIKEKPLLLTEIFLPDLVKL